MNSSAVPAVLPRAADSAAGPLAPGTHTITVDHGGTAVAQRYHVAGAGGPVCVALSGGPGIGWEYLRMPLLERAFTMVYVEPVGTGESGRLPDPREYTLPTYTHFLNGVIEHLAQPPVTLLGHSYGGFVAQQYALEHPEHLASLVLYDTSPVTGEEFWADAVANMERFARRHVADHPEVARYVEALTAPLGRLDDDGATECLRAIMPAYVVDYWGREDEFGPARGSLRMYAEPSLGEGPAFDVRERLSGVTAPTLVLVGAEDFICGPRWARMLHERIPGARLAVLDGTGHLAHVERPAEFTDTVAGFLREHTVPRGPGH
ncbi:alpha/beta fold hydrolase [Actinacidiphila glaucinigra]|uniref:alpha/beta fold hydrolase n=1 Tax=Actinacidiphila glaucinigra TaxID=235986 RepID=UPI00379D8B37